MDNINLKKSTTTKLKIKEATIANGKLVVEDEIVDLLKLLSDNFDSCIFDLVVAEKVDENLDIEGVNLDDAEFED